MKASLWQLPIVSTAFNIKTMAKVEVNLNLMAWFVFHLGSMDAVYTQIKQTDFYKGCVLAMGIMQPVFLLAFEQLQKVSNDAVNASPLAKHRLKHPWAVKILSKWSGWL